MSEPSDSRKTIKLWDVPTRLFHWLLAVLFFVSLFTGYEGLREIHETSGVTILALVLFRIIWGLVGSSSARFSGFIRGPKAVVGYTRALIRRAPPRTAGHNPLGGWMVAAFLVLLLAQAGTGLFANDDIIYKGPLAYMVSKDVSDTLTSIHKDIIIVLIALVSLHIVAITGYWAVLGENLVRPMFTGAKKVGPENATARLRFVNPVWAVIAMAVAAGFVWWLLK